MPFLIRLELGGVGGLFDTWIYELQGSKKIHLQSQMSIESRAWKFKWEDSPIANVSGNQAWKF